MDKTPIRLAFRQGHTRSGKPFLEVYDSVSGRVVEGVIEANLVSGVEILTKINLSALISTS